MTTERRTLDSCKIQVIRISLAGNPTPIGTKIKIHKMDGNGTFTVGGTKPDGNTVEHTFDPKDPESIPDYIEVGGLVKIWVHFQGETKQFGDWYGAIEYEWGKEIDVLGVASDLARTRSLRDRGVIDVGSNGVRLVSDRPTALPLDDLL